MNIEKIGHELMVDTAEKKSPCYEVEDFLKLYRKIKFNCINSSCFLENCFSSFNKTEIKEVFFDVFYEKRRIESLERQNISIEKNLFLLKIMNISLELLEKYPDKGMFYAELLDLKYFTKEKNSNEKISEKLCVLRSTYYRYLKQATFLFGEILFGHVLPQIQK